MSIKIICVDKPDGYLANPYETISRFGWVNESTGASGYTDMAGIISYLEKGNDAYTKDSAGDVAYLEVGHLCPGEQICSHDSRPYKSG